MIYTKLEALTKQLNEEFPTELLLALASKLVKLEELRTLGACEAVLMAKLCLCLKEEKAKEDFLAHH